MKKKFALSFVALASVALLAACGEVKSGASNTTGNPVDEKTIKIGFNFEETGAVAAYGTSEQKGAQLAVDEINAAGGIDGKQIEVVDKDNKSETAEAASVTTNLVTQSKVDIWCNCCSCSQRYSSRGSIDFTKCDSRRFDQRSRISIYRNFPR